MSDSYKLDEKTARKIFEAEIVPSLFADAVPTDQPKAVIFGGQPGAGKTKLVDRTVGEIQATVIEGDQFRAYHPKFNEIQAKYGKDATVYTGPDAGRWTEMAIKHGIEKRYNLAIEGTMRSPDTVRATTQKLRDGGYEVEARAMAVPDLESWQGVHLRYEQQHRLNPQSARFTPRAAHDAAYTGMLSTMEAIEKEKLVSRLQLYTRSGEVIYESQPGRDPPKARAALEGYRDAPFAQERAIQHDERWALVQKQQHDRNALDTERLKVDTWRNHDRMDLMSRTAILRAMQAQDPAKASELQQQRNERHSQALEVEKIPNRNFTGPEKEARIRQLTARLQERSADRSGPIPRPNTGKDRDRD